MAGYSQTPLARKLGIRAGHLVVLIDAPATLDEALAPLPEGVRLQRGARGRAPADVIVCFNERAAGLRRRVGSLAGRLAQDGGLWLAWPKKSSGVPTDLSDGAVREIGLGLGLVDNKVCAIDETWSGLRFVRRLRDRRG